MTPTDTPRTNAACQDEPRGPSVNAEFARQLERDLAAERGKNVAPQPSTANTAITAAPSYQDVGQGEVAGAAPGLPEEPELVFFKDSGGLTPASSEHLKGYCNALRTRLAAVMVENAALKKDMQQAARLNMELVALREAAEADLVKVREALYVIAGEPRQDDTYAGMDPKQIARAAIRAMKGKP